MLKILRFQQKFNLSYFVAFKETLAVLFSSQTPTIAEMMSPPIAENITEVENDENDRRFVSIHFILEFF